MTTRPTTGVWRRVLRIHDAISLAGFAGGAVALGLIVVIYAYEVTVRYFFISPTMWASDFVSFLLLISVFLVIPWLSREGGHVAVTLLPDMMPARWADRFLRVGFLVAAIVCLWSAWISVQETQRLIERGTTTLTTVRIPKWTLIAFVTYGLANAGLYFLRVAAMPTARLQTGDTSHA